MALRLYNVPVVGDGTRRNERRAKYFQSDANGSGKTRVTSSSGVGVDYGFEPTMFVYADLPAAEDVALVAQADVLALPFNLDQTLSALQVTNTQNKLEAANIPAGWVNTTLTWREVARTVLWMFTFKNHLEAIYAERNANAKLALFGGGVTLATPFNALPAALRSAMQSTATEMGIPTTGLTGAATLRAILKTMADFFQGVPYDFGIGLI